MVRLNTSTRNNSERCYDINSDLYKHWSRSRILCHLRQWSFGWTCSSSCRNFYYCFSLIHAVYMCRLLQCLVVWRNSVKSIWSESFSILLPHDYVRITGLCCCIYSNAKTFAPFNDRRLANYKFAYRVFKFIIRIGSLGRNCQFCCYFASERTKILNCRKLQYYILLRVHGLLYLCNCGSVLI